MLIEINKRLCKKCNVIKDRISGGKFDKKNKRWVDKDGKCWNGSVCPTCHKGKVRDNMRKLRTVSI